MGFVDIVLYVMNVCRSVSDVLHILLYVSFAVIAALCALYRTDKELYLNYVYYPMLNKFPSLVLPTNYVLAFYRGFRSGKSFKISVKSNRKHYRNRKK